MSIIALFSILATEASSLFGIWLGTPTFAQFHSILFARPLKHHHVGWGASVHRRLLISPEILNHIQGWALAGTLTQGYSQACPETNPLITCLCAWLLLFCLKMTLAIIRVHKNKQIDLLSCREGVGHVMSMAWFPPNIVCLTAKNSSFVSSDHRWVELSQDKNVWSNKEFQKSVGGGVQTKCGDRYAWWSILTTSVLSLLWSSL